MAWGSLKSLRVDDALGRDQTWNVCGGRDYGEIWLYLARVTLWGAADRHVDITGLYLVAGEWDISVRVLRLRVDIVDN